ncbi:hypothetical protein D3C73_1621530 [compost metagenome]
MLPTVIVAKPALQYSNEVSRTLRHSIARYKAAAAAKATEIVSIVGGSNAIYALACLVNGKRPDCMRS